LLMCLIVMKQTAFACAFTKASLLVSTSSFFFCFIALRD